MNQKPLSQMMPDAWPLFFKRRGPNLIQKKASPLLIQGKSLLLSSPTASGKTEAVVAPIFQRHVSFKRDRLSIVYVAPTKALVNDLYYRLDSYFCSRMPGAIRRYTGDHHELTNPENVMILLATPEALDSLQLVKPESLNGVRALVIDEVHLLHGNARGQQLRHVIRRIEKNSDKPKHPKDNFQKIGMTATLHNINEVCTEWLGKDAISVKVGDARAIDISYLHIPSPERSAKPKKAAKTLSDWFENTSTPKALVFGNTRNSTQILAANLYKNLKGKRWPVHWHTGILTAIERERVEDAMKNERFGICVATSTLEVGIDIGDIDVIVLLDPPFSINAFLQRIGRGNRKTDICKVLALFSTDQELSLYKALHHCALTGVLDDIHDYDRAAVRFQQILSFAWRGVSRDKTPLTRKNLVERTCDDGHLPVVEDMLSTGAIENVHGALVLSDELMDQGERRQIHTTISGAATMNLVDSATGDSVVSVSGQELKEGGLYVGGKLKHVKGNPDGTVSLETAKGTKIPLSTLPATRGKRGFGRRIVWAMAEIAGYDPHLWQRIGDRLTTWGGADYNHLLAYVLDQNRMQGNLICDEYGISGISPNESVTADRVIEKAMSIFRSIGIPSKIAHKFCERSRYFSYLSREMQDKEAQSSIPFPGFMRWLKECIDLSDEDKVRDNKIDPGKSIQGSDNDETFKEKSPSMTGILRLCWEEDSGEFPALVFAETITRCFFSAARQVNGRTDNTPVLYNLDLEDCLSLLKDASAVSLDFISSDNDNGLKETWTVRINGAKGNQAEILISHVQSWQSSAMVPIYMSLQWLQTTFDSKYNSSVSTLTLVRDQTGLHQATCHAIVAMAKRMGHITDAELLVENTSGEKSLVASWHPEKPNGYEDKPYYPVTNIFGDSLWLPVIEPSGKIKEVELWYEPKAESTSADIDWNYLRNALYEAAESKQDILKVLQSVLDKFYVFFGTLEIREIESVNKVRYMAAPQQGTVLVLSPENGRVVLAVDTSCGTEIADIVVHGLGHIFLGHVRPRDDFGHSDTLDSIKGIGALKYWDRQVSDLIRPKKESSSDCTPHEKACLGLYRMIGEMLGESRHLHPKAEQYQNVIYQRKAAQRLLAMLEEYRGAMLCDGVGLGKTYVTTTLIVHYANMWRDTYREVENLFRTDPFRITVLAPNSVVSTWQREALPPLTSFGVPLSIVRVISHTKLSRITRSSAVLEKKGTDNLSDLEHLLFSDFVVVDEAHNFRSLSARRTIVLRDLLRLQHRKAFSRRVLLLTATPVNNSLDDLMQEISLLYSRPISLSNAATEDGYRRQAITEITKRCDKARSPRGPKGDVAPLIIQGESEARFSQANDFRDDLDFGPNVQRIGDYLKEQDKNLKKYQDLIRDASRLGVETNPETKPVRIGEDLLDRIVVQRSRSLCKSIESQQGSEVELLFRPDAGVPEKLYYSDEYDGIGDVLARFLPLFDTGDGAGDSRLSLKVYMWYDVREGIKTPDDMSPVVGLQRILVLKRLESSPVAFLITLLRLTVLHAYRVQELLKLCKKTGDKKRVESLHNDLRFLLYSRPIEDLEKISSLATGSIVENLHSDFVGHLGKAYSGFGSVANCDDKPLQLLLFEEFEEESSTKAELDRLWKLKDILLRDLGILLSVTPSLADVIFGRFSKEEWPRKFTAGGEAVDWPTSPNWGLRIITDAKLRALVSRLLKARRQGQKVIVFSQFSDPLAYVFSVLKACRSFTRQEWSTVITGLKGLDLPDLKAEEIKALLDVTAVITGDTENRDSVVNSFSPYYRIGPTPPPTEKAESFEADRLLADWNAAWNAAIRKPVDVLLSTDVLAEGVNLQDAAVLINFDVHWNPVRMIQRAGRIDRRLNPAIEKVSDFPELRTISQKTGKPLPAYYWHSTPDHPPLTVNMILPDELEAELMLRERIAVKTLAIDFTLGLEQGTGAEAQWMEEYKYHGIASLNSFQKDRAIEQIAGYHERFSRFFAERGIRREWTENLNSWICAAGSTDGSPLVGRALLGRRGGELERFGRYLEPLVHQEVPYWFWAEKRPGESMFDGWLVLDGRPENFPPKPRRDIPWNDNVSMPIRASHLLGAAEFLSTNPDMLERPSREIGRPLMQGASALAAPKLGSTDDRKLIAIRDFLILQIPTFEPGKRSTSDYDMRGNENDGATHAE